MLALRATVSAVLLLMDVTPTSATGVEVALRLVAQVHLWNQILRTTLLDLGALLWRGNFITSAASLPVCQSSFEAE